MPNISPEFSFDTYGNLDQNLEELFARNRTNHTVPTPTGDGLGRAVDTQLGGFWAEKSLPAEVLGWAQAELNMPEDTWEKFDYLLARPRRPYLEGLLEANPNHAATLQRLHAAQSRLQEQSERSPDGQNLGESMHLVMVPWQAFRDNLTRIETWVSDMRDIQSPGAHKYYAVWGAELLEAVQHNKPLYRTKTSTGEFKLITPTEYLDRKIATDGAWGIMLAQTDEAVGMATLVATSEADAKTPYDLTQNGLGHLEIAGQAVDAMGVFEWLALTFQEDLDSLSTTHDSWLLANRLMLGTGVYTAAGSLYKSANQSSTLVKAGLQWSRKKSTRLLPHLAVL